MAVFQSLILYSHGFLSRSFTDQREISHGGSAASQTGLLPFLGRIAPGMIEFWASTGATWRDMLLAETLVMFSVCTSVRCC